MRHAVSVASVNAAAISRGDRRRNRPHVRRRHDDVLRERPGKMLAEQPEARTERLFAVATVLARAVAQSRD